MERLSIVSATEPSNEIYGFLPWRCSAIYFWASFQNFQKEMLLLLQTCSNGTFSQISGSSAFSSPLKIAKHPSFQESPSLFIALTNIWQQILLMHLEFKAGLEGNNPTTSSLFAAMCDENLDHHPLLQCPRHTLAELSHYRGQARWRRSAGVLGALLRKYEGSWCLVAAVLLGRCFIYNTDVHSLLSSDSQNEEACAGGGQV